MLEPEQIQQQPLLMAQTSIIENNINNSNHNVNHSQQVNLNNFNDNTVIANSVTKTSLDPNTITFEQSPTTTVLRTLEKHSEAESTSSSAFSLHVDVSLSETKNPESDDKVSLTLLLVSGKRHTFLFDPNDTTLAVKAQVFTNWPKEWADETPVSISSLTIIYRGRFLEDTSTLESNKILCGQPTIAHLTIRNVLNSDFEDLKSTENSPKCHCIIL